MIDHHKANNNNRGRSIKRLLREKRVERAREREGEKMDQNGIFRCIAKEWKIASIEYCSIYLTLIMCFS